MPDLSAYMTPDEFAALPSDAHHAVWAAHRAGRVDGVLWSPGSMTWVYNRAQVRALLRETAETRG